MCKVVVGDERQKDSLGQCRQLVQNRLAQLAKYHLPELNSTEMESGHQEKRGMRSAAATLPRSAFWQVRKALGCAPACQNPLSPVARGLASVGKLSYA